MVFQLLHVACKGFDGGYDWQISQPGIPVTGLDPLNESNKLLDIHAAVLPFIMEQFAEGGPWYDW